MISHRFSPEHVQASLRADKPGKKLARTLW